MGTAAHASDEDHQLYARPQDGQSQTSTHLSSVQIIDDGAGSIQNQLVVQERTASFVFKNAVAVAAIMYLCYLLAYNRGTPIAS